ncbi:MAG TPA: hypothetical protein VFR85_10425 [Anaeromyxobacteraceae bacterium]|nr:hypothetical protein [Anaeromyxobacteraceae bacterium]
MTAHPLPCLLALALLAPPAAAQQPQPATGAQPAPAAQSPAAGGWPQAIQDGDLTFLVYQPQIDSWEGDRLSARQAVAVQKAGQDAKSYGVVWLAARTDVDKEAGRVRLYELAITKASFPGDEKSAPAWREALQKKLLGEMEMSLERLQMALAVAEAEKTRKGVKVRNDPPAILFREKSAMLVYVDGKEALRPLEGTGLERVINTRPLVVRDPASGRFSLRLLDGWMEAEALDGPWRIAQSPPASLAAALDWGQKNDKVVDLLVAKPVEVDPAEAEGAEKVEPPSLARGQAPEIVVARKPTELVVTDGPPNLAPIDKTGLLYWTNTRSDVLVDTAGGQTYLLLSGRWFAARTTAGPWTFVPPDKLPKDFAAIPDDGPKGNVLASVAGTPQAAEARIANSIPQTATVKKSEARFTASYDGGSPKLQPIEGTSLHYAANSPTPVIQVTPQSWYACVNGVWFTAAGAAGPWAVATSVPAAIYAIPSSSSLHYVTYVKVYGSTAETVTVGYTPGYMGTVTTTTVVVYGTGYYYPPYIGPTVWYGPPVTFGFGVHVGWSPWTGWHMGFSFGFYGPGFSVGFGVGPWWGPMPIYRPPFYPVYRPPYPGYRPPYPGYRPPYGGYPGAPGYRPPGGTAPAPPPGGRPPGGTAPAPPPGGGGRPSTTPSRPPSINSGNVYGQWGGAATRPATPSTGARPGTLPAGGGARPSTGDVYAGRDGNVYRPSQGGGWEKHGAGGWQNAPKAQPQMNREQSARQWGDYRASSPSASRPSSPSPTSYRGGGGGGYRGGGGRGGGRR